MEQQNKEKIAMVVFAEGGVFVGRRHEALIGIAQCVHDLLETGQYNGLEDCLEKCFTKPDPHLDDECIQAVEEVWEQGARRFPDAKILQFRSFSKYSDGHGHLDPEKAGNLIENYDYLGSDSVSEKWGHFYFGKKEGENKMYTGKEVSARALEMYNNREKYAYLYGAKGETGTDSFVRSMFAAYPDYFSRYSNEMKEEIVKYCRGKKLYDCSGFVCECAGIPDVYSGKLYEDGSRKTTNMLDGKEGWLCYKPGHVGIDRGDGTFLHIPTEMHTIEPVRFADYDWTHECRLAGVDYSYEDAQTVYTVQPGDTLSGIAAKYGTTYQHLAAVNGIQNPDVINVGQKIVIQ